MADEHGYEPIAFGLHSGVLLGLVVLHASC